MTTPQHRSTIKGKSTKICTIPLLPSVAVMLREMQREVNTGHPFERKRHIDYLTSNHPTQHHAANDIDCSFITILSWRKPAGPRIMRKLWSNLIPGVSMNSREQIAMGKSKEDIRVSEELKSSYRGRHRPHGCTSRLRRSPNREWNSETVISGCDQQICPDTSLSS